jgi:hypothetical protein
MAVPEKRVTVHIRTNRAIGPCYEDAFIVSSINAIEERIQRMAADGVWTCGDDGKRVFINPACIESITIVQIEQLPI